MCPVEDPMTSSPPDARPMVLIVEDEVIVRLAISAHLRDCGFTVVEAANGAEAQALVLSGLHVDLVFSDVNMPNVDGIALALWLSEHGIEAPVVLTSGMPSSLDAARAACGNVRAFLPKPYSEAGLVDQLRAVLSARD